MPEMNDTLHCRCSKEFKLQMQAAAKLAGLTDGDFIRDAVIAKIQQVEQEMTNDRPAAETKPTE